MTDWMHKHVGLTILIAAMISFATLPWVMGWILEYNMYVYKAFNK